MITPPDIEPVAVPWHPRSIESVLQTLRASAEVPDGRPFLLAVDGRQGGGKTTAADQLAGAVEGAEVVHSDDVAWWESFFGWDRLMATGILEPLRRGKDVDFRPPAWEARGREGSVLVSAMSPLVIIEGVGVGRRSLAPLLDATVWVQSDLEEANKRGIARQGGSQEETDFWWEWDREEQPFLADDRPWQRADVILCGTPHLAGVAHDPATEVLVGRSLRP